MSATPPTPRYLFRRPAALGGATPEQVRVAIVGAGVVGLTMALELARRGVASVMLDEDDTVSTGSRAICWAKRTLEIYGRLGLGERFLEQGVTWSRGRVFHRARETFGFDLLAEQGHEYPAFVNLQQYHAEVWLVQACEASGLVDLRWKTRLAGVEHPRDGAMLRLQTPAGDYAMHAEWLLACDGAGSTVRRALALPFIGQEFRDRFLIADVVMQAEFPTERWFWFDPPFHPGQSVLLHKQPDNMWRIDFQLGPNADPEAEKQPDKVIARVQAMLAGVGNGPAPAFQLEWVSVYSFQCRRLERFRHGRILFAGDSAHQVSPFGARGGNGGVQDVDNLGWKLAAVLAGEAPECLLDSYDAERLPATDENILNSARATDFITPKSPAAQAYRDAVLELAARYAFARPLVNSGRLSRPAVLHGSALHTPSALPGLALGSPPPDAPVLCAGRADWLLRHLGADGRFCLLCFGEVPAGMRPGITTVLVTDTEQPNALWDHTGLVAQRWGASPGDALLLRPDQHLSARLHRPDAAAIVAAHRRALGHA